MGVAGFFKFIHMLPRMRSTEQCLFKYTHVRDIYAKFTTLFYKSKYGDKTNIMTAAWQMPVSHSPMLVAVSIAPARF